MRPKRSHSSYSSLPKKLRFFSLKHSPGLLKEVVCLSDCFSREGVEVTLHLRKDYKKAFSQQFSMSNSHVDYIGSRLSDITFFFSSDWVKSSLGLVFYNSHPWNLIILMWFFLMDKRPLRILVLHEPLKKNKIRNFGIFAIKVFIVEWFNKLQSWLCTDIIVLSPYAKVLVESSFGYNPKTNIHEARILLDPLNVDPDILVKERKYASFIGNINGTKGLGGFYNLAHYSWANCYNHLFALVTGSTLSGKDRVVYDLNNITITQKSNLSDFEIEQWMTKSIVVFCLHKSVTQSGVLVECMRTATPIICADEKVS